MSKNFFTSKEERKYKEDRVNMLLSELYNFECEVAFSVDLIFTKKKEMVEYEKEIVRLQGQASEKETIPEDKKSLHLRKQRIAGFEFKRNTHLKNIAKLFKDIDEKTKQMKSIRNAIDFNRSLDLDRVPQLPCYEITNNGETTKYRCENNTAVMDEHGIMIEYHDPDNTAEVASAE